MGSVKWLFKGVSAHSLAHNDMYYVGKSTNTTGRKTRLLLQSPATSLVPLGSYSSYQTRPDDVRQAGVKCGVVEVVTDHAAMAAISLGTASIVGGVSSAMASVCM